MILAGAARTGTSRMSNHNDATPDRPIPFLKLLLDALDRADDEYYEQEFARWFAEDDPADET